MRIETRNGAGRRFEPLVPEEGDGRRVDEVVGIEHRRLGPVGVVVAALGDLARVESGASGQVLFLGPRAAEKAAAGVLRGGEVEGGDVRDVLVLDQAARCLGGGLAGHLDHAAPGGRHGEVEAIEVAGVVEPRVADRASYDVADVDASARGQLVPSAFDDGDRLLREPCERHGRGVARAQAAGQPEPSRGPAGSQAHGMVVGGDTVEQRGEGRRSGRPGGRAVEVGPWPSSTTPRGMLSLVITLLDGPLGTELAARGVPTPGPGWSAFALDDAPEVVVAIHRDYARAGATVHTANTFRTKRRQLGVRWEELARRAIDLARGAVPAGQRVAGSIAPLEDCYRPDLSPPNPRPEHRELARALAAAGADSVDLRNIRARGRSADRRGGGGRDRPRDLGIVHRGPRRRAPHAGRGGGRGARGSALRSPSRTGELLRGDEDPAVRGAARERGRAVRRLRQRGRAGGTARLDRRAGRRAVRSARRDMGTGRGDAARRVLWDGAGAHSRAAHAPTAALARSPPTR